MPILKVIGAGFLIAVFVVCALVALRWCLERFLDWCLGYWGDHAR